MFPKEDATHRRQAEGGRRDHSRQDRRCRILPPPGSAIRPPPAKPKIPMILTRDPGGSSAGTGAAIAANLATVGIGEDTGGSIRLPASFNSLVGVRVTPGLISRTGLSPLVVFQDTAGPDGPDGDRYRDPARRDRRLRPAGSLHDRVRHRRPQGQLHRKISTPTASKARASAYSRKRSAATSNPDCAQVNAVVRAAIKADRSPPAPRSSRSACRT